MQNTLSASSESQKPEDSIAPAAKLAKLLGNSVTVSSSLIDDDEQVVHSDPYMDLKRMILQMNVDMNQKLEGVAKLKNEPKVKEVKPSPKNASQRSAAAQQQQKEQDG